jgi:hypothetical protein
VRSGCSGARYSTRRWTTSAPGTPRPPGLGQYYGTIIPEFKGLPHEMDLAFDDMHAYLVLGLNRGRVNFLNFSRKKRISRGKCEFTLAS